MSDDNLDQKTVIKDDTSTINPNLDNGVPGGYTWPVPQIMVRFGEETGPASAWGRDTLKHIGYLQAIQCFCKVYVYNHTRDGPKWKKFVEKNHRKIYVKAKFHQRYGNGLDEGWVRIRPIGWIEMIDNVSELLVFYDENRFSGK